MKKLINLIILLFCMVPFLEAQMPFHVQLLVNDEANTLKVNIRNVESAQPTMGQKISTISMRLLGQVGNISSVASTNYTMQLPTTSAPNTQVISMSSTDLSSPESWAINQWVTVVEYNLIPGSYTNSSFSVQPDDNMNNSDVQDPIMSVAAAGVFNISLVIQSTALPIVLRSFDVTKIDEKEALIQWESELELNFDRYEVEKAVESNNYQRIASIEGRGARNYEFIDENPTQGLNSYRLKMVDLDGNYKYSRVRSLRFKSLLKFTVHPNPSSTGDVSIVLQGLESDTDIHLSVTNSAGDLVKSEYIISSESNLDYKLKISDVPGIYFVRLSLTNGQSFIEKVVVRN